MNEKTGPPVVATGEEVLMFLTGVMRGEENGSTQNMKAAELLGKRLGIFSDVNSVLKMEMPVIVDDIPAAEAAGQA